MTPNQYTDTYKRLSDEKLINIIDNKNDYQPLAIETAIFELQNRQLSDKQINDARQSNVDSKNKKDQSDKKVNERIDAVKNTADKALTILDPLVEKTPDRTIKLISLALGVLSIVKIISNFSLIVSLFKDTDYDFSVVIFLFDLLFLPIALIQFWKKRNSGRILLSIWLTYNLLSAFILVYLMFSTSHNDSLLTFLLPQTDPSTFVFTLLLSIGLLYYINKKEVRTLFK
jgi:hypothetical protein